MTTTERLNLVRRVGEYFKAHSMWPHLEKCRAYYAHVRDGSPPLIDEWTDAFVDEWAAMLRLPPFEKTFEVRPFHSECTACGPLEMHHDIRAVVFHGGALQQCLRCGGRWLELGYR